MKNEALKLHKLGLKVIPVGNDKMPKGRWKSFQDEQTTQDVEVIFFGHTESIALLTGHGIEVIDIDVKYFLEHHNITNIWDSIYYAVGAETFEKLLITRTMSGGFHVIYKTTVSEGNQKLASRYTLDSEKKNEHDKIKVLLETRGEGGYILIPPSQGYSFDNPSITFENIPTLTDEQRNGIISACRSFDEIQETYTQTKAAIPIEVLGDGMSTIEAYNKMTTCDEILERNGWQKKYQNGKNIHFVRPGKTLREGVGCGYSPTLNLVRVFTSSTQFECNKSYNPFQVYAILEHGGDYSAAAKELYHKGIGDRMQKGKESHKTLASQIVSSNPNVSGKASNDGLMESIFAKRLDISVKPTQKPNTLFMHCEDRNDFIGLGGDGDLINFFGREKTRKSAAAACAASCFLEGGTNESLYFKAEFDGRKLVHFDTEQSEYAHHKLCSQMLWQVSCQPNTHPKNFYSYNIMPYTKLDRLNFVRYAIDHLDNIGCVFIDGIVDLCRNYNDLEESSDLVTFLMNIAAQRKFLLIDVLHNARSTGSARGHLGSELLNKANCNINVTKEEGANYSTLKVQSIRGAFEPKGFDFGHDEFGNIKLH